MIELRIKRNALTVQIPKSWTAGSIGLDLHAHLLTEEGRPSKAVLPPRCTRKVSTGIYVEPPSGLALLICSRSGLAQESIFIANSPGVVDPDYRGEICILLYNGSHETKWVCHGDRIAQLVAIPAFLLQAKEVEELSKTERGELGFGSTGL